MEYLASILPFILILVIFYFILIRPQQKQQKQRKEMLDNLKAGDNVITIGGIKGKIIKIKDDQLRLRISSNVDIDMIRSSISHLDNSNDEAEKKE